MATALIKISALYYFGKIGTSLFKSLIMTDLHSLQLAIFKLNDILGIIYTNLSSIYSIEGDHFITYYFKFKLCTE